ncbi:MAG TPA: homoserine dehydrogenase [Spirochaetota bacterium]|nr:homoserine dehydrogenase [Spirochaetota bacterium]
MKEIKIGLIGCGIVGSGVTSLLQKNAGLIRKRSGIKFRIKTICALNMQEVKSKFKSYHFTKNYHDVLDDPEIDIVVELIGGTTTAYTVIKEALNNKKHVVTANKAVVSKYADKLFLLAVKNQVELFYEAAIGGGIPVIKVLREGLIGNRIKEIYCIINGTSNFILSQMANHGLSFASALALAQKKGFAEADPALDINGGDAMHKTVLLSMLAFKIKPPARILQEGIESITAEDVAYAAELGYKFKLLGIIKDAGKGYIENRVHPALVPEDTELAAVENEYNAVLIKSDFLGSSLYYGRGAGSYPTASAVVSDICDIGNMINSGHAYNQGRYTLNGRQQLMPLKHTSTRYYVKICTSEKPGILGKITSVFGRYQISIKSVIQKETFNKKKIPIIFITHQAREEHLLKSLHEIKKFSFCKSKPVFYRIEDLSD